MKTVKLLLLLLIPAALLFMSCENELPEEAFFIEEILDITNQSYTLSDADYFELSLYKKDPEKPQEGEKLTHSARLEKGEILRLEGLDPGYYRLTGIAYKINDNFNPDTFDPNGPLEEWPVYQVGTVWGKSDKMATISSSNYMIIDEANPVIVKLIFFGDPDFT